MTPDALITLNGGLDERGDLTNDTRVRVETAMRYAIDHDTPSLAMVGRDSLRMREFALDSRWGNSLPPIYTEEFSHDTIGNAHYSKIDLIKPLGWQNIIVCTADYHLPRSNYIFGRTLESTYSHGLLEAKPKYSARERKRLEHKELVLKAMAWAMLLGIGAQDDTKRQQRLLRWNPRYR